MVTHSNQLYPTHGMRLVWLPVLLVLILCAATYVALLNFSLPLYHNILGFSSCHLFMFLVFHAICLIVAKSYRPSSTDVFVLFLPAHFRCGVEEEHTEDTDNTYEEQSSQHSNNYNNDNYDDDDDKNDDEYYHGSDGYNGENDDDGSDGVVGWDDDEEFANDLESRIEGFIAKVIKGWKEELSRENLHNNYVD